MRKPTGNLKHIAIAAHPTLPEAQSEADKLASVLQEHGFEVMTCLSLHDDRLNQCICSRQFELVIVLGGDGTMLRAGRLCAPAAIPVLGINMGKLGFLMEVERNGWREIIPLLSTGNFWLEERMMLRAQHLRGSQVLGEWDVLNEVVICRGQFVRPVQLKATMDGYLLANYMADGLIAATPTGSTAYAMAAGGPILPPELRNILIMPVAPHLSLDRAIVLPEGGWANISVHTSHEAVLSVDGQYPIVMLDGDYVHVGAHENPALFVRFQDPGYFYRNLTRYMEQNPAAVKI